ncbi:MAG: hypothetical protein NUW37_14860, partial [Planctomycetes bacterium]|nr:hypothetical protein [Planctomycetota bacterium]
SVYSVYWIRGMPQGHPEWETRINFQTDTSQRGNPVIQPDNPNYGPKDDEVTWDGTGNHSSTYDDWIDANGEIKVDLRNP